MPDSSRPVALITGTGRRRAIGAAIASGLAEDGWDIAFTYWKPYDERMPWGGDPDGPEAVSEMIAAKGGHSIGIESDLSLTTSPAEIFDEAQDRLGPVSALV
ncbi:MAG TPA: hypothetical protein VGH31_02640, partial [Acidimicrobiales bacterium]